jgi:hypothetical protein
MAVDDGVLLSGLIIGNRAYAHPAISARIESANPVMCRVPTSGML